MVFQFHYLFEHLTALQNVTLAPVHGGGVSRRPTRSGGPLVLLESLGVAHRADALAAGAVGRRGAARGDRAGAGHATRRCC